MRITLALSLAALALGATPQQGQLILDDPLQGGTSGTQNGGSFQNGGWQWMNSTMDPGVGAVLVIPSPGVHTVNVWMREDGFVFDKLLLTTDATYTPTGTGPAESAQSPDPGAGGGGPPPPSPAPSGGGREGSEGCGCLGAEVLLLGLLRRRRDRSS